MEKIKYKVSLREEEVVKAILKKYGISFNCVQEFNDHGVRGKELVGAWINCTTFITKAVDELCKVSEDMSVRAYKQGKNFYKLRLKALRKPAPTYGRNDSGLVIPF